MDDEISSYDSLSVVIQKTEILVKDKIRKLVRNHAFNIGWSSA